MKRVILTESEKKRILINHNLLIESNGDQQILMDYKNELMSKKYVDIAKGLEIMKTAPGVTEKEKQDLDQAISYLSKGESNSMAKMAHSMVDKEFSKTINENPDRAKNMLCHYLKKSPSDGDERASAFCLSTLSDDEKNAVKNISNYFEKKAKETIKTDVKPEDKKVGTKSTNTGSFMDPYGSGSNTSPGSFMNPYGS